MARPQLAAAVSWCHEGEVRMAAGRLIPVWVGGHRDEVEAVPVAGTKAAADRGLRRHRLG